MAEIESEAKFMWKFILHILITPFTLLLVLLKKKSGKTYFNRLPIWSRFYSNQK